MKNMVSMDLLDDLNPQQRLAVEHGAGPALVLAGAGSGKTRTITYRIAYLIRNGAARPENILAVTFTNKAAKEMRERIHALLGPMRSAEPLISTFHSFCVRLLRREIQHLGYKRDFSIYDTDDQRRAMKMLLKELGMSESVFSPREVLSRISFAKNHKVSPGDYTTRFPYQGSEDIALLYEQYEKRLRQANALDFDDLLLKAVESLDRFPELRNYYSDWYRYILVDEYQDTNRPQYELLCQLTAKHTNLFVVGDEDQSIYKFRGADIQNILRFEKDFPGARIVKLEENYRSTQNILDVAGAVVSRNIERKGKTLWTENPRGDMITCRRFLNPRKEAEWAARQIHQILAIHPSYQIGILYRANFLSRNFEDVLTESGIPYALVGSTAFFGRMEVKDMLAYLRVLFNPEDDVALLRVINTPSRGIGNTTVELLTQTALQRGVPILHILSDFAQDSKTAKRASHALLDFQLRLNGWMSLKDTCSLTELLQRIVDDTRYREMLVKQESAAEAENRMANVEELMRATAEAESRGETVFEFLDRASLSSELDDLDSKASVILMTLHGAKGLEFDVVFLAGLEEGLLPHSLSVSSQADLEEERRLCYVGITRSRHKLYLTWTPFRRNFGSSSRISSQPSRFLSEMPADLVEGRELGLEPADEKKSAYVEEEIDGRRSLEDIHEEQAAEEERPSGPKTIADLRTYLLEQESGKPKKESPGSKPLLKPGMRVCHPKFGDGIILSRERAGVEIKLTITFSRSGKKTLVEKYAKLEVL
jgi:DNA helicase-2/ATP-dependent DNA helicase PcrA